MGRHSTLVIGPILAGTAFVNTGAGRAESSRDALTQAGAGIAASRFVGHWRFRAAPFLSGAGPKGRGDVPAVIRRPPRPLTSVPGSDYTDRMEPLNLPLDYAAIERILPHRYPFLLVDRITEFEVDKRIVGIKNVSLNERYLAHRPGERPVLPPTILTEAVNQVGAILILAKPENREKLIFIVGIERVRYRRPAHPGDVLHIEVKVKRLRSRMGQLHGVATANGKVVLDGRMTFALGPTKRAARDRLAGT